MKLLVHFLILLAALPALAQQPQSKCEALSFVPVNNFFINGTAYDHDHPLYFTQVSLYSHKKLIRRIFTDPEAGFTLYLMPGSYRLVIQGLGSFDLRVVATSSEKQTRYYTFYKSGSGCLSWGFNMN